MTTEGPVIRTRVAHAMEGEHAYCGYEAFGELLAGNETLSQLFWLAVGGARLSPDDRQVLDDVAVAATAADPRVWPLKIARLCASYGGSAVGVGAGIVSIQNSRVGPWNMGQAAAMLVEIDRLSGGSYDGDVVRLLSTRLLERHSRLPGFGVAFRDVDERVTALCASLERRGRRGRRYYWLFERFSEVVRAERKLEPNIGAAMGACLLDLGLDVSAVSILSVALFSPMFFANAAEGAMQASSTLRSLPASCVTYAGRPSRTSPRALERRGQENR